MINRFENGIKTPEEAYWLGFIVGDGCIYENRYRLKIALSIKDVNHLKKFLRFLGLDEDKISFYGFMCEVKVDNKKLLESLYKLGLVQNKVRKTHSGLIPKKFVRDFIRGLFDADGTIHLRFPKKYMSADLHMYGTFDILKGIKNIINKNFKNNVGYLSLSKDQLTTLGFRGRWLVEKIGHYLYDNSKIYLERKYKLFRKLFEYNKKYERKWNKFSEKDILEIRQFFKSGKKQKKIAKDFEISQSFVSRILNNKRYSKLNLPKGRR